MANVQNILDNILNPAEYHAKALAQSERLDTSIVTTLYDIVDVCESNLSEASLMQGLNRLQPIVRAYSRTMMPLEDGTTIPMGNETRPFLVLQVIMYLAVRLQETCNMKDKQIAKLLHDVLGIKEHFFSEAGTSPTYYHKVEQHIQPKAPYNYLGQKHGMYGIAIKHLAYQAGKYTTWIDLFGGSASATAAVCKKGETQYIYNEGNITTFNAIRVIADDVLYKELIAKIKALQNDILGIETWLPDIRDDAENGVDFLAFTKKFFHYIRKGERKENELIIYADDDKEEFIVTDASIIAMMKKATEVLRNPIIQKLMSKNKEKITYSMKYGNKTYSLQYMLKHIFPLHDAKSGLTDADYLSTYKEHRHLILTFLKSCLSIESNPAYGIKGQTSLYPKPIDIYKREEDLVQYRAYKYYAYFYDILKSAEEEYNTNKTPIPVGQEVLYAVAYMFIASSVTRQAKGISDIIRMVPNDTNKHKGTQTLNFLYNDFSEIKAYHKQLKGLVVKNGDFREILKAYNAFRNAPEDAVRGRVTPEHYRPLIYSDSPYINTKNDYGIVFGVKDMKDLIQLLMTGGYKYIFSCRAVISNEEGEFKKKENKELFESVFQEFASYNRNLWVLAFEQGKTLEEQIKDCDVAEIMITNYYIVSFIDQNAEGIHFKVYTFDEFMEIAQKHLLK